MISLLSELSAKRLKTITPDRGKEFAKHADVTAVMNGVQFYFPDPHAPWQRGTNENTNGLIREYLPKSFDMTNVSEEDIRAFVDKLNNRPARFFTARCCTWLDNSRDIKKHLNKRCT